MRSTYSTDIVAAVPYLLGFHPSDSLVIVTMQAQGPHRLRSGPLARIDLAEIHAGGPAAAEGFCEVLDRLADASTRAVVLLAYHDGPHDDLGEHLHAVHLAESATRHWDPDVSVELLSIGTDSWGCLDCLGCCPPEGHPRSALDHNAAVTEFVAEGYAPAHSRDDLAVVPTTDAALRDRIDQAMVVARREREQAGDRDAWRARIARRWDEALLAAGSEEAPGAPELGVLLDSVQDVLVRDAVVAAAISGRPVADIVVEDDVTDAAEQAETAGPRSDTVRAVMGIVTQLAACAPPRARPAPLGIAAYLSWWLGEGARADVLAQQCLETEPEHRLATLVLLALEAGMPPPWVTPRSTHHAPIR